MPRNRVSRRISTKLLVLLTALAAFAGPMLSLFTAFLKREDLPQLLRDHLVLISGVFMVLVGLLAGAILWITKREEAKAKEAPTHELTPTLRGNLLANLRARYHKRLHDSLEHQIRLNLDLQEVPNAVTMPGLKLLSEADERPLPGGTSIQKVFSREDIGERLLILGQPGAGKTTLMLELAMDLVDSAIKDKSGAAPIPVIINLASWAKHEGSIRDWLVTALDSAAGVSNAKLARTLTQGDHLLVLFDGLDEVQAEKRAACIGRINDYLGVRVQPAVVCSRIDEYEGTGAKLILNQAIRIDPLDPDKVRQELKGLQTQGVREALRDDPLMRELATTPLMLSVVLLTYMGQRVPHSGSGSTEARRQQLWDDYVVHMIRRRYRDDQSLPNPPRNIFTWLSWLGGHMKQDGMTDFILDHVQPTWLTRLESYRHIVGLLKWLVAGLVAGLVYGLVYGLVGGLVGGLVVGLNLGVGPGSIEPEERIKWSWRVAASVWRPALVYGLVYGLVGGLALWLLLGVAVGGVLGMVGVGFLTAHLDTAKRPGDRLRSSLRNGLVVGLAYGGSYGLVLGLVSGMVVAPVFGLDGGLVYGLFCGLISGVVPGLLYGLLTRGGGEFLKHYVLRACLVREGAAPWRYVDFLLFTSDLLLLQQDNDVIRFRHLLLRDYFACLTPERIETLGERADL